MTREDWFRLWLHAPWGLLGALLYFAVDKGFGALAIGLMIAYEAFNDWRKKDESYKDVLGIVWGVLIAGIVKWISGLI
jgi:hypothetical protein